MQMFMALGHKSRVECAHGGDVSLRFVMQSFTTAAYAAHIFTSDVPYLIDERNRRHVIGAGLSLRRTIVASL
jgi:hypothetical protein